ncbi:MAG: hypothetical protein KDG52_12160 [Rhodocyclaceae bacterium]|nr:hypothetical protein [Rhodocyclaceae bacterium]
MNTANPFASAPPPFIDVEASGLGRGSHPIEVGIVLPDGARHCWLIRPPEHWSHWDPAAETIHGISRARLHALGRAPAEVAEALNEHLAGHTVYSDAWGNDMPWLARLFDEAGQVQRFRLESVRALLAETQVASWHPTKENLLRQLSCERHRASSDAMVLQRTWLALCAEAQSDAA